MDKDYLQLALGTFNQGKSQWYGWKKDWTGEKRMSYENLILNDDTATMPTEAQVNAKIQELKDAEAERENKKTSGKQKLKDLGLEDDEIQSLLGV
jgi:hypothetical protein|tara:strand:- start:37 stop:321 length:285 start_codon:yes stop_codon:yes gene_type:complete